MFFQYHRYSDPYCSEYSERDSHLTIAYPADHHAMLVPNHDFYVIGCFHDLKVSDRARLTVQLRRDGRVLRQVECTKKNDTAGMKVDCTGILTENSPEELRRSGMPDLVYDPAEPDSFWYTWNKAFYHDGGYCALIYGGTYDREHICQKDQWGKPLEPIAAGICHIRVILEDDGNIFCTEKTVRVGSWQKEIILSRYSPEAHVERVRRFAEENGFERYTDPYAGIWDTEAFSIPWPQQVTAEIPERWWLGDAQEYMADHVAFFDYNMSEKSVGYRVEMAGMLAGDAECPDKPEKLKIYYYRNGHPEAEDSGAEDDLLCFAPGQYLGVAPLKRRDDSLFLSGVVKPLPSAVTSAGGCGYVPDQRIGAIEYTLLQGDWSLLCRSTPVGLTVTNGEGEEEFLPMQFETMISLDGYETADRLLLRALDQDGVCRDALMMDIP